MCLIRGPAGTWQETSLLLPCQSSTGPTFCRGLGNSFPPLLQSYWAPSPKEIPDLILSWCASMHHWVQEARNITDSPSLARTDPGWGWAWAGKADWDTGSGGWNCCNTELERKNKQALAACYSRAGAAAAGASASKYRVTSKADISPCNWWVIRCILTKDSELLKARLAISTST